MSTETVIRGLRDAIVQGDYSPRDRLIEAELAEEYDASRFIVRKALVQLAAEGLVEIEPNRGARVREISVDDAIALTEVRGALEGLVASRAAARITQPQIERLRSLADSMRSAVQRFDVVRYSEVNRQFHTALREIADHAPATKILEQLNAQIVGHQFVLALVPGRPAAALREHLDILDAVCAGDAEAAEQAMRFHVAQVISVLRTFKDGGAAAGSGIRELARKVKLGGKRGASTVQPTATVAYSNESEHHVLDLYIPDSGAQPFPVVLSIHGGAFLMGDRTWELAAVPQLLDAGFAVASIDYRLSSEATFPAAVRDVKRATAYLRRNSAQWHLDEQFFAAWGRSAGGYLAAMLGVTAGVSEFEYEGDDSHVDAVIDWYGPSDFLAMDEQFAAGPPTGDGPPVQRHSEPDSPESRFLGAPILEVPELVARANPITYIEAARQPPPFFLAAGTNDRLVPYQQSQILADALRSAGGEVVVRTLRDASHADHQFEAHLVDPAIQWLKGLHASS